jgi:hypothetical protein
MARSAKQRTSPNALTSRQRHLVPELDELSDTLGVDYWNISAYERGARTPKLEQIKRHLVIGEVVRNYTLVDEFLNMRLCHYFFSRRRSLYNFGKRSASICLTIM